MNKSALRMDAQLATEILMQISWSLTLYYSTLHQESGHCLKRARGRIIKHNTRDLKRALNVFAGSNLVAFLPLSVQAEYCADI